MGAARRPRGRLPQRVYWFRRTLLLVLVVGTVVGIAHLVGGTGTDDQTTEQASPAGARAAPSASPSFGPTGPATIKRKQATNVAPAEPSGECDPQDISALPTLEDPEGGGPVQIQVALQGTQPACTFEVAPDSLVLKITDDKGRDFWRSQDCPQAVPREEVVVRSAEPTDVTVTWSSRASDRGCGDFSRWALPGYYDALVSVQGSQPSELRFELLPPSVKYVTKTPKPKPSATAGSATPSARTSASPSPSRTPSPTRSASPRG